MTINYNGKDVELKYTFRGYIIYENIIGESFKSNGMKELIILYYSMCLAAAPDIINDFETFVSWLDNNPETLNEFSQWLVANVTKNNDARDIKIETEEKENKDEKEDTKKE